MSLKATQSATIEALSLRLRKPLRRFFEKRVGVGHRGEVDDLVQEVFIRLTAENGLAKPANEIDAYLFKTAKNLLQDYRRRLSSRLAQAHEEYDEARHGAEAQNLDVVREILGQEALERLIAALYGLPERTRNVWILYHFEGLPHSEISRRIDMPQSTIEKHMARANAHLLGAIERFR